VRDPSAIEAAAAELSTSRKASTLAAAAGEFTDVAARVTFADRGRCRTALQHEHEQCGDEQER
jgi:hypothetical protein